MSQGPGATISGVPLDFITQLYGRHCAKYLPSGSAFSQHSLGGPCHLSGIFSQIHLPMFFCSVFIEGTLQQHFHVFVEVLTLFIYSSTQFGEGLIIILNSLSDKFLISISLRFFLRLSFLKIRNRFLCFFILLDPLC